VYKVVIPKLFVDYGRRQWPLGDNRNRAGSLLDGCGHKFKATNGWNKAEAAVTSKKGVDETGLMAVTCFHSIGVRYLNLYGGNEHYSHGTELFYTVERSVTATASDSLRSCSPTAPKPPRCASATMWPVSSNQQCEA
jgi:hypothetical protein